MNMNNRNHQNQKLLNLVLGNQSKSHLNKRGFAHKNNKKNLKKGNFISNIIISKTRILLQNRFR